MDVTIRFSGSPPCRKEVDMDESIIISAIYHIALLILKLVDHRKEKQPLKS